MSVTGMMTATATKRIMMIHKRTKAHKGMPQNLRGRYFSSKLGEPGTLWPLARPDLGKGEGHLEPGRSPVGVARDGEGKAASMSAMEPSREPFGDLSFSLASRMLRRPSRLAVFPRSRFEANFVARLINSGRLLELPRTSESLVAARFSRGGLLAFFICLLCWLRRCSTPSPDCTTLFEAAENLINTRIQRRDRCHIARAWGA